MSGMDPIAIIDDLDPDTIRQRLDQLARQREALCVLLRAAVRRGRALDGRRPTRSRPKSGEDTHAQ
jgi:hypothetical protein